MRHVCVDVRCGGGRDWIGIENKDGYEKSTYIVFLDDLEKTSVVEASELCEIVHIGNDMRELLLEQGIILVLGMIRVDDLFDLLLGVLDPAHDFTRLDLLERVDLVELLLEQLSKGRLVILCPPSVVLGEAGLELGLELVIGKVVEDPLWVERSLELVAKLHWFKTAIEGKC